MIKGTKKYQEHINFFNYALNSVFTYRARTTAILFCLAFAVMILGSTSFISDSLLKEAELSTDFAPDITVQAMETSRLVPVEMVYAERIEKMPEVERVAPRIWGYIYINEKIYTVLGIDIEKMPIPATIGLTIESGSFLPANNMRIAVIGNFFAQRYGIKVNDTIVLSDMTTMKKYLFNVGGIFSSNVNLYASDLILVNLNAARVYYGLHEGYATDLCVYLKDKSQMIRVATLIARYYPNLRVLTRDSLKDAVVSTYSVRAGYVSILWYILLLSVVLVAWNQASSVTRESQREVGILKAVGFSTSNILEIRLIEALLLGFFSATIGLTLAIVYVQYFGAPFIRDFMLGWASAYPYYPIPIYISFSRIITLYAVAIFPLFLGSLIPVWRSAITEPDIAMRGT